MAWLNLYDTVTIGRIVTWIKHANSDGVEHKIASAAVFRSERLTKSNSPVLEGESVRPWDGTMIGRIMEWMSSDIGNYFQIEGGNTHCVYENQVQGGRHGVQMLSQSGHPERWSPEDPSDFNAWSR
jgi:hypothetical protein